MGYTTSPCYVIGGMSRDGAPVDSLTYLMGQVHQLEETGLLSRCYIPRRGIIRTVTLYWYNISVNCTTENTALSIRVNNATDYAVYTGSVANAASPQIVSVNVPVNRGDYVQLKMVCPVWVTNPAGQNLMFQFEIEPA